MLTIHANKDVEYAFCLESKRQVQCVGRNGEYSRTTEYVTSKQRKRMRSVRSAEYT